MENKGLPRKIETDFFFGELRGDGVELRGLLWPLSRLSPRERAIFTEYHYWNTHMRVIADSHKISLGRAYEILYRAEKKIASSRAQEEKKAPGKESPEDAGERFGREAHMDGV